MFYRGGYARMWREQQGWPSEDSCSFVGLSCPYLLQLCFRYACNIFVTFLFPPSPFLSFPPFLPTFPRLSFVPLPLEALFLSTTLLGSPVFFYLRMKLFF